MEWLAFEAEHAMMFARGMNPPPPREWRETDHWGMGEDDSEREMGSGVEGSGLAEQWERGTHDGQYAIGAINGDETRSLSLSGHVELRRHGDKQNTQTSEDADVEGIEDLVLYLHRYRSLRDLNLLYIDGMSAGKTYKGTLDSQDYILLSNTLNNSGPFFDELERGTRLCNLTRTVWAGKIDGFIRMECGFEILLCQFEGNVGLDRLQRVRPKWIRQNQTMEEWVRMSAEASFRMYEAVSDRFWSLGGNRVKVEFDNFVTAFSRERLTLFERMEPTQEFYPRLRNVSQSDLQSLKDEVTQMIEDPVMSNGIDWQSVSDMYVQRYAGPLQALLLPDLQMGSFRLQLQSLLRVFTSDYLDNEQVGEVIERCTDQFLPHGWNESLAGRAVQNVGSRICGVLVNSLFNTTTTEINYEGDSMSIGGDKYDMVRQEIQKLVSWLDWPIWRYCSSDCAANERCILPIWPITDSIKDRERPTCKNSTKLFADRRPPGDNGSYWYGPDDFPGKIVDRETSHEEGNAERKARN